MAGLLTDKGYKKKTENEIAGQSGYIYIYILEEEFKLGMAIEDMRVKYIHSDTVLILQ